MLSTFPNSTARGDLHPGSFDQDAQRQAAPSNQGDPMGLWLERWVQKALHEATSTQLILEMTAGGMGYRLGRVAGGLLARKAAMGAIGRWMLPRGAGFFSETAAFSGASLFLASPFPEHPVAAYGEIFRSSGVMFGSLRLARAVLGGHSPLQASAAIYAGVAGNHLLQQQVLHWEETQPFSVLARESLAEAVTFSIGGHVSHVTMGRLTRPLEHSLDLAALRNETAPIQEINHSKKPSSPPASGGLFGMLPFIGLSKMEGPPGASHILDGALEIFNNSGAYYSLPEQVVNQGSVGGFALLSTLSLGALGLAMRRYRKGRHTVSDAKIAQVLTEVRGDRKAAAERLPIKIGTINTRISEAGEGSPLAKHKGQYKVSDDGIAHVLEQVNGDVNLALRLLPINLDTLKRRIANAKEDSRLAKVEFIFRKSTPPLLPLALGFGAGGMELLSSSKAHALVPGLAQAGTDPGVLAWGEWGSVGLALGVLGMAWRYYSKRGPIISDADIAKVMEEVGGNRDLAVPKLPIKKGSLYFRIANAKKDSPLAKYQGQYKVTNERIAQVLEETGGDRRIALASLPITRTTLNQRISSAEEGSPLAKFKTLVRKTNPLLKASDEEIAAVLEKHGGNQTQAAKELPITQTAISARIRQAREDSPLAKSKRKGRDPSILPLALAASLGEQLRLSPEQLNKQYPHLSRSLDFLTSLAAEKGWTHQEKEQFLISHYLWLSDPHLVEMAAPVLRDPDLGFKSLNWIFSFREKGRSSIDIKAEIESRVMVYGALKGLEIDETGKVDFYTRWHLAGAGRIKSANFPYSLTEGVFSALQAMDKRFEEGVKSSESDLNREHLRRTYAMFLTSFGQYQRAVEVFAPLEGRERIYPEQKTPLLKVQMAEHYFHHQGFPEVESNGRYPKEDFFWQGQIRNALDGIPSSALKETTLPLRQVIPFHFLYHARWHEIFVDTINQIRKAWLFDLMLKGWQPGSPVPPGPLKELMTSVEFPHHLPTVSGPSSQGFVMVLNGHHRLSTLISLVADGIFPPEILAHVPLEQAPEVRPTKVIQEVFPSLDQLPKFSWADVMQFHDHSAVQIPKLGLNADYRHLR